MHLTTLAPPFLASLALGACVLDDDRGPGRADDAGEPRGGGPADRAVDPGSAGDADPPPADAVTVRAGSAGVTILWHDASGQLLGRTTTDAAGDAFAYPPPGGSVTRVDWDVFDTVLATAPGDVIALLPPGTKSFGGFHADFEGWPGEQPWDHYQIRGSCTRTPHALWSAQPFGTGRWGMWYDDCPTATETGPVVIAVRDADHDAPSWNQIRAYAVAEDVPFADVAVVDLPLGPWQEPDPMAVALGPLAAGDAYVEIDLVRYRDGRPIWSNQGWLTNGVTSFALPDAFLGDDTLVDLSSDQQRLTWRVSQRLEAIDVAIDPMPRIVATDHWSWTAIEVAGDGSTAYDAIRYAVRIGDVDGPTGSWTFYGPPPPAGSSTLPLPELPDDLAAAWPVWEADFMAVSTTTIDHSAIEGYAAFRAEPRAAQYVTAPDTWLRRGLR